MVIKDTPLSVKHKEKTYLSFKKQEEIHFTNNTGVLGGACGLHNVHVKIHTNADIKVIFEDNILERMAVLWT